jgi:transcription antitermination factor NusG
VGGLTWWIATAEPRRVFGVETDIKALDVRCEVPREVYAQHVKRKGIIPADRPILGGYVFFDATADQWHKVVAVKHLRPTMQVVSDRHAERLLLPFVEAAAIDYAERRARIEAGERVAKYQEGDRVMILAGRLAGEIVTFRRMADTWPPKVIVSVGMFGGRDMALTVDALQVGPPESPHA